MKQSTKLKIAKKLLTSTILFGTVGTEFISKPIEVNAQINEEEIKSIDDHVLYYCNVFNLNHSIIERYIKNISRNYTAYEFEHYYYLGRKQYDSIEQAILETIRNIYYRPEDYLNEEDVANIKSTTVYQTTLSPEELCEKYSVLYNIDRAIPMAISYSECGVDMASENFLYNNNPAGIGPYIHFENTEIAYIYFIKLLTESYRINENSTINDFNRIAPIYCTSNPSHWEGMARSFYYELSDNYYKYDETREYKTNKKLARMK